MIKFVFSVYDNKARAFSTPFFSPRQEMAVRDFTAAARDPQSVINQFPEDYTLYEIGEFDDDNATFNTHTEPLPLGKAIQFKE